MITTAPGKTGSKNRIVNSPYHSPFFVQELSPCVTKAFGLGDT